MFLLLGLLLLIFLPSPWNLAAALASTLLGAIEVLYWEYRMSSRKVRTGVEDLVGATAEVTSPLAPLGQIAVHGELWEAHSHLPIDRGARVQVVGIEDLRLEVRPVGGSSRRATVAGSAALLAVVVLAFAGCGGDDGASASEDYADGVCSSLNTWATDVEGTVKSLADAGLSVDKDQIRTAVSDVDDATQKLSDDLEGLGPPETDDGEKAKAEVDDLLTVLREQVDSVEQALDSGSGVAAVAGKVTTAVSVAANAIDMTYQELRQLDPSGELQDAFESSEECKSLQDQLERNGS
jgi:membrane protein implicated in regulation of membrane protease activity